MKSTSGGDNTENKKDSKNLLNQNIWKELEETKITAYSKLDEQKIKEVECLMDRAFYVLLEKIIRQN